MRREGPGGPQVLLTNQSLHTDQVSPLNPTHFKTEVGFDQRSVSAFLPLQECAANLEVEGAPREVALVVA